MNVSLSIYTAVHIYVYIYTGYTYLHISRILEARAFEEVMVDHGGVGRNLGLPCAQSFNLDRAFNTQPHTNVIQVTKDPEVPPTRARKDVWIISIYSKILLLAFLFLSECFAILEWVLCHSWVSAIAYVCLEYVAILVTWRTLCCYILLCCVLVDFHILFYCVLQYGAFLLYAGIYFATCCYMMLFASTCCDMLPYVSLCCYV